MIVYILVAVLLLLGCIDSRASRIFYRIDMLVLFAFTAFRNPDLGGTDAINYQRFFNIVPKLDGLWTFDSYYRFGYTLLSSLAKTIYNDYIFFQIVYAACTILLLHWVVKELNFTYTERCLFLFSFYCYRFIWSFWVTLRQNIANLLFWLLIIKLYKAVQENRVRIKNNQESKKEEILFLSLLVLILPPLFHSSAYINIIFVPVIFILKKIKKQYKMIFVPLASIVLYLFGNRFFNVLLNVAVSMDNRYTMYIGLESGSNAVNFIFRLVFFCLYCNYINNNNSELKEFILDSSLIMVMIGSINHELMLRCYEYYAIGMYAGMAQFPKYFKKNSVPCAMVLYVCGMLVIFIRYLIIMDGGAYLPYRFYS